MKIILTRRSPFLNNQIKYINSSADFNIDIIDTNQPSVVSASKFDPNGNIQWTGIFLLLFSVLSFIFDTGSDCYLMMTYYKENDFVWFILTLIFVVVPAIVMTTFSLIWYCSDEDLKFNKFGWFVRLFFHVLLAAPLVRYVDTLIYAWKTKMTKDTKKKKDYYQLMIYEEADSSLLRIIECSMESTPQLLLQLYILFTQPKVNNVKVGIQISSSIISLISLSWCLTSYQSSLRITTPGKMQMKLRSMVFMVIWKILFIFPRFFSIALFTSVYKLYILFALGSHYCIMAIYIIAQETTFFSQKKFTIQEILFNLVVAVIYCVDYLNLKEGITRFRYIAFYAVSLSEVCILILFWYNNSPFDVNFFQLSNFSFSVSTNFSQSNFYYQKWSQDIRKIIATSTICSFLMAVILMCIYYTRCHPTNNIKIFLGKDEIKSTLIDQPAANSGDSLLVNLDSNPTSLTSKSAE